MGFRTWPAAWPMLLALVALLGVACERASDNRAEPQGPAEKEITVKPVTEAQYVNTRCPIMHSPIEPQKVTADLTRQFEGQTVAFCCAGCPSQWDKLSAVEKRAKLAQAGAVRQE